MNRRQEWVVRIVAIAALVAALQGSLEEHLPEGIVVATLAFVTVRDKTTAPDQALRIVAVGAALLVLAVTGHDIAGSIGAIGSVLQFR